MLESQERAAQQNFTHHIYRNAYPGRGIVAGLSESGEHLVQVYWIMGRSENSKNRVFKQDHGLGRLYTAPADPSKVKDPSLIIYNAMMERLPYFIVSNGDQTDTVWEDYRQGPNYLNEALAGREYEPDKENYTQRITAVSRLSKGGPLVEMSILRKSTWGMGCDRILYAPTLYKGFGYCITTYAGDAPEGQPLPSFQKNPLLMPLQGDIENVAKIYWNALNGDNRVSLAVKFIEIANGRSDIHIINKYTEVG